MIQVAKPQPRAATIERPKGADLIAAIFAPINMKNEAKSDARAAVRAIVARLESNTDML